MTGLGGCRRCIRGNLDSLILRGNFQIAESGRNGCLLIQTSYILQALRGERKIAAMIVCLPNVFLLRLSIAGIIF